MRSAGPKVALAVAAVVVLAAGVHLLRESTMSTHYDTHADSRLVVVVRAAGNRPEEGVTLEQMATTQIQLCGLEVAREGDVRTVPGADTRFEVTLRPALDSTDRKQYEGCLEDWTLDHLRLHVESLSDEVPPGVGGPR